MRSKNITQLALFILILCTTAIGPQEPQYDDDEDALELESIETSGDDSNNSESGDDTVSSLMHASYCQPICTLSDPKKPWYMDPSMAWEDKEFNRKLAEPIKC